MRRTEERLRRRDELGLSVQEWFHANLPHRKGHDMLQALMKLHILLSAQVIGFVRQEERTERIACLPTGPCQCGPGTDDLGILEVFELLRRSQQQISNQVMRIAPRLRNPIAGGEILYDLRLAHTGGIWLPRVLILNDIPSHQFYIESHTVDLAQIDLVTHHTQRVGYELMPGQIGSFSLDD